MLESVKFANGWQWSACGKHRAAKDYFSLGLNAPLLKAFSHWVETGYQLLASGSDYSPRLCSWRFWAKGAKKKTLVCGMGRDSSDSLGRPYPLLVMGTGPIGNWKDYWDLLPFACEKTWNQMESLSNRRFADLKELEGEVCITKPPRPLWSEYASQRGNLTDMSSTRNVRSLSWNPEEMKKQAAHLSNETEFFVPLDKGPFSDPFSYAAYWHSLLKENIGNIPNAVFMGGTTDKTYLAVFKRPLAPDDFVRLWSITE